MRYVCSGKDCLGKASPDSYASAKKPVAQRRSPSARRPLGPGKYRSLGDAGANGPAMAG
jgi:hypothetical protein